MDAAKPANLPNGIRADRSSANLQSLLSVKQAPAADHLNAEPRSVASARKVLKTGDPELAAAVDRANMAVSTAADRSRLPIEACRETYPFRVSSFSAGCASSARVLLWVETH